MTWKLSFKGSAFHALSANVPKNDLPRVLRGLDTLCDDPLPDGRQKRKLKDGGGLFRCKVHGYRVMYVFDDTHVSVLDIRPREDDHATYGSLAEPEHLGAGLGPQLEAGPGTGESVVGSCLWESGLEHLDSCLLRGAGGSPLTAGEVR